MKSRVSKLEILIEELFKIGGIYTFVGAGGKSSLIEKVADFLNKKYRVQLSTTTRLAGDNFKWDMEVVSEVKEFQKILNGDKNSLVIREIDIGKNKFKGFSKEFIDSLNIPINNYLLIEGDGSRKLPFKIPKSYEPVIPDNTNRVILVLSLENLNKKINLNNFYNAPIKLISKILTKEIVLQLIEDIWIKDRLVDLNTIIIFNKGDILKDFKDVRWIMNRISNKTYLISTRENKWYE